MDNNSLLLCGLMILAAVNFGALFVIFTKIKDQNLETIAQNQNFLNKTAQIQSEQFFHFLKKQDDKINFLFGQFKEEVTKITQSNGETNESYNENLNTLFEEFNSQLENFHAEQLKQQREFYALIKARFKETENET